VLARIRYLMADGRPAAASCCGWPSPATASDRPLLSDVIRRTAST
jgi:hypothetical protein